MDSRARWPGSGPLFYHLPALLPVGSAQRLPLVWSGGLFCNGWFGERGNWKNDGWSTEVRERGKWVRHFKACVTFRKLGAYHLSLSVYFPFGLSKLSKSISQIRHTDIHIDAHRTDTKTHTETQTYTQTHTPPPHIPLASGRDSKLWVWVTERNPISPVCCGGGWGSGFPSAPWTRFPGSPSPFVTMGTESRPWLSSHGRWMGCCGDEKRPGPQRELAKVAQEPWPHRGGVGWVGTPLATLGPAVRNVFFVFNLPPHAW